MIKYYKELEEKKQQYLDLVEPLRMMDLSIKANQVPIEFYKTYYKLFCKLADLDVLLNDLLPSKYDNDDFLQVLDCYAEIYSDIYDYLSDDILAKNDNFKRKFALLMAKFKYEKGTSEYYEHINLYITSIINIYLFDSNLNMKSKNELKEYLESLKTVATFQGKLAPEIGKEIDSAIKKLNEYDLIIPKRSSKIKFNLPDSWYITPSGGLYNSMGENGHKGSNLKYAYYEEMDNNLKNLSNSKYYLNNISNVTKNGFITDSEFQDCVNLIYHFTSYYDGKNYDKRLVNLIAGIYDAHACFYEFFEELKLKSTNYNKDLNFIKKLDMSDLLVRVCGFHKISSQKKKTITTSRVNYEHEFSEYLKNGWYIDFVPPIIINENRGRLEEYPQEFLTIRKILKK